MSKRTTRRIFIGLTLTALLFSGLGRPSLLRGQDLDEALERLEAASGPYVKGLAAFKAGQLDKAESEFQACLSKFPDHAYAHYYLANIRYIGKDFAGALACMDRALAGFDAMAALDAKVEERKSRRRDAARLTLDEMGSQARSCRESRTIEWEQDALEDQAFAGERAAARRAEAFTRLRAHYVYFRANALFQLQRVPEAFRGYEEAVRLDPRHPDATNNLLAILFVAKEYAAAQALLEKAEAAGLEESLNLELKERLFKALGKPVEGILSEDLVAGGEADRLSIRRFALAVRQSSDAGRAFYVNAYVVFNPATHRAVLIDPGAHDTRITEFVGKNGLSVKAVLVTHAHPDHYAAGRAFAGEFGAELCAPRAEARFFPDPPDRLLKDGDRMTYEGLELRAFETPGHTPGGLCFVAAGAVFSGDTLFRGDIGALAADDAQARRRDRRAMLRAIRDKILTLADDTLVCPGHGKMTTVGAERPNIARLSK